MPECAHCHRVLKNEAALLQHCKDKGHPFASTLAGRPAAPAPASASKTSTAVPSASTVVASSSVAPLYECKPCGVSYLDKLSLDQHNASKHPPKPFKCAPCGVDFSTTDAFSIHLRNSPKHPKCPQCNSGFIDETQLKLHQARHQKCVQCGSLFVNKVQLEEVSLAGRVGYMHVWAKRRRDVARGGRPSSSREVRLRARVRLA